MPINEKALRRLLFQERLTHGKAALRLGVSIITVTRAVKRFGLQAGRGVSHRWTFTTYNHALAYVVGLYLTDGWTFERGMGFSSTEPILINRLTEGLHKLGLPVSNDIVVIGAGHLGTKPTLAIKSYSTLFSRWLKEEFQSKTVIPKTLMKDASIEVRLMFLAGIIDGDGSVGKDGHIVIRTSGKWLNGLGEFLEKLHIRHKFGVIQMLPSGKLYCRMAIRRSDYRALGGKCFHPMRAWRIIHGKDRRIRNQSID